MSSKAGVPIAGNKGQQGRTVAVGFIKDLGKGSRYKKKVLSTLLISRLWLIFMKILCYF